jgi:hypothetical protein
MCSTTLLALFFWARFSQVPRPRFMQGYQFSYGRLEMTPTITGQGTIAQFQWIKIFLISYYNTVDTWRNLVASDIIFRELGM